VSTMLLLGRLVDGSGRVEGRIISMIEAQGKRVENPSHLLVGHPGKKLLGQLWRDTPMPSGLKRWHGELLGKGITAIEAGNGVVKLFRPETLTATKGEET
jgi:hypothetical protein